MLTKPNEIGTYISGNGRVCAGDITARDRVGLPHSVSFANKVTHAATLLRRASTLKYGFTDSGGVYHLDAEKTLRGREPLYERAMDVLAQLGEEGEKRVGMDEREGKIILTLDGESFGEFDFHLPGVLKTVNHFFMVLPNYKA